jgi:chemotaxis protein histidine kinase CheA
VSQQQGTPSAGATLSGDGELVLLLELRELLGVDLYAGASVEA